MAIYNATMTRTDSHKAETLCRVANGGKKNLYRAFVSNGEQVIAFFEDCGEFTFEWDKTAKVWEFKNEAGAVVGYVKAERDTDAENKAAHAYYLEVKAAYEAQERAKG